MPHPAHSIEVRISPASRRRLSRLLRESRVLTEQRLQAIFRSAGVRAGLLPGGRIFERETGALDPAGVELIARDLPMLRDLVLVDCPDPDTTEEMSSDCPKISCGACVSPAGAAGTAAPQNSKVILGRTLN